MVLWAQSQAGPEPELPVPASIPGWPRPGGVHPAPPRLLHKDRAGKGLETGLIPGKPQRARRGGEGRERRRPGALLLRVGSRPRPHPKDTWACVHLLPLPGPGALPARPPHLWALGGGVWQGLWGEGRVLRCPLLPPQAPGDLSSADAWAARSLTRGFGVRRRPWALGHTEAARGHRGKGRPRPPAWAAPEASTHSSEAGQN